MSEWIAAVPMYDWPERRDEVDAEWAALRDRLRAAGVDARDVLTRDTGEVVGWTAKRKGLPFITAKATPPDIVDQLKRAVTRLI